MISAFRQIRLTNSLVTVTGAGVLQVGNEQVVYKSETGNFVHANQTGNFITSSQTGSFGGGNTGSLASAGNLAATGSNLQGQINTNNSVFNTYTGKFQSFTYTPTPLGLDSYFVQFPINFSSIPRVSATLEVTGQVIYNTAIQNRSVSGYYCLFSDLVTENVSINTIATLN